MIRPKWLIIIIIVTIAVLVLLTWLYHLLGMDWELYVTTAISLTSLIISMIVLFKNELLPFHLEVEPSHMVLVATNPPMGGPVVVLVMCFINSGYSDAVVDWVAVAARAETGERIYLLPGGELVWPEFYKTRFVVTPETPKSLFTAFLVPARSSKVKAIIFDSKLPGPRPILSVPGKHRFTLYVKTVSWKDVRALASFEREISQEHFAEVEAGGICSWGLLTHSQAGPKAS